MLLEDCLSKTTQNTLRDLQNKHNSSINYFKFGLLCFSSRSKTTPKQVVPNKKGSSQEDLGKKQIRDLSVHTIYTLKERLFQKLDADKNFFEYSIPQDNAKNAKRKKNEQKEITSSSRNYFVKIQSFI
jgi:hypothetical protein